MNPLKVNITIPTFNREACIEQAIESALKQSYADLTVTVVDDASRDSTWKIINRFRSVPRFSAIRLGHNVGTAQAKNISILMSDYDAITFHDSDDIASPYKIMLQARALQQIQPVADEMLDWEFLGYTVGQALRVDVCVGAFKLIKRDGSVHHICKRISLVDDFFPHLQFPSKTEGDWTLINAGLFRKNVFQSLGGYLDSIEEDRELRNRLIAAGHIFYFIEEPLLTKIECDDSLTMDSITGYKGNQRKKDRHEVWERNRSYKQGLLGKEVAKQARVNIETSDFEIVDVIHEHNLTFNEGITADDACNRLSHVLAKRNAKVV